jgi:hypothetical protein
MKFKLPTLAAAAALLVNCAAPVLARSDITVIEKIGHWTIQADATRCEAVGAFEDDSSLSFLIDSRGVAVVGVGNRNWRIPNGEYEVEMRVDRAEQRTFRAMAEGHWVAWQVPFTEATLNLLSYGRAFRAKIGTAYVSYDLTRSEAAIKALVKCAVPRLATDNPFAGQSPQASAPPANPFAETPSNPYRRM